MHMHMHMHISHAHSPSQAALVLIDAALMQRTRLGGSCTTVSDARTPFVPGESNGTDGGPSKKQRQA